MRYCRPFLTRLGRACQTPRCCCRPTPTAAGLLPSGGTWRSVGGASAQRLRSGARLRPGGQGGQASNATSAEAWPRRARGRGVSSAAGGAAGVQAWAAQRGWWARFWELEHDFGTRERAPADGT